MRLLWVIAVLFPFSAMANNMPFEVWLENFKIEAQNQGISQATINEATEGISPIERIIELDRKQPEGTKTLTEYLENIINLARIEEGKVQLAENLDVLKEIEAKYGVDKEVIVALWGIETSYGENTGNFSIPQALATLAYDGRRSEYFRAELINALKIIDADHIKASEMDGSWAGAMGQCQFMPTSFLKYAVDYNQDGKRDIWNTKEDVFASIANYLSSEGWVHGQPLAMPVNLPEEFAQELTDIKLVKPLREWRDLGVTYNDGSALPDDITPASVILVGRDRDAVPYIVYNNFKVILKWNRSRYFATAVDMLSEELR